MLEDYQNINKMKLEMVGNSYQKIQKTAKIAEDLFLYSFHTLGYDYGHKSIMNLAPTAIKQHMVVSEDYNGDPITYDKWYKNFLKYAQSGISLINPSEFSQQFILNNLELLEFVYTPIRRQATIIRNLIEDKNTQTIKNSFRLDLTKIDDKTASQFTIVNNKEMVAFVPVIKIDNNYMAQSGETQFNVTVNDPIMTYVKVEALGKKGLSKTYSKNFNANDGLTQYEKITIDQKKGNQFNNRSYNYR